MRAEIAGIAGALLVLSGCVGPGTPPPVQRPAATAGIEPLAPPAPSPAPVDVAVAAAHLQLTGEMMQGGLLHGSAPPETTALLLDGKPVPLAPDHRFIIAFDRDATPAATLTVRLAGGEAFTRPLTIAPREWNISRLSSLPKYPVPSADFERLRPPELAAIAAARVTDHEVDGWRQRFRWPVTGRISTLFGSQRIYANGEAGSYHSGIDIARPTGTPVMAPADGVVILAADHPFTLEGNLLMIDHGMGLNSAFLHLSRIDVAVGDHVRQGQVIGAVGATGRATGPHLHWGLKWRNARIDPLLVVGPMPAR